MPQNPQLKRGGSILILGPYTQIQQIIKSKRRPIFYILFNPITAFSIAAAIFAFIKFRGTNWPAPLALIIAPPIALLFLLMFKNISGAFTRIVLVQPHQQTSFWSVNKEKIWLMVIGAIIGGILTKIVSFLLTKAGM